MSNKINLIRLFLILFIASISLNADDNRIVYLSQTGVKYHIKTCRTLKKKPIPVTLKEAKRRGYTACKVCRP